MLTLKNKLSRLSAVSAASFTMGTLASTSANAAATNKNFNDIASNITTGIETLPGLVSAICYMMGLLFAVLGMLKIKDHVENPSQTQLKDGAIRLAVGGGLFAIPIVSAAMQDLINGGNTATIDGNSLNKVKINIK
jgi:hypothetical protein